MSDVAFALVMLLSPFWAVALGGCIAHLCPRYFDVIADRIDHHGAHRAALDAYDHHRPESTRLTSTLTDNHNKENHK